MKQIGIFVVNNQNCLDGIIPTNKSSALARKYNDWWKYHGHRQCTIVLRIYEKTSTT